MKLDLGKTELKINISFAAVLTVMLILDESCFSAVALLCCIAHEAGHIITLLILGERPKLIELSFYGIKLERELLCSNGSFGEMMVYLSGPAANFILSAAFFLLSKSFPNLFDAAKISLCVGAFNLIPCIPLDGGNLLLAFLCRFMSEKKAEKTCSAVRFSLLLPMGTAGIFAMVKSGNFTLFGVTVYLASIAVFNKKAENK